jgi:hypothetical protein
VLSPASKTAAPPSLPIALHSSHKGGSLALGFVGSGSSWPSISIQTKEKKETSHAGVGGGEPCDGGREKMGLGRKWGEMKMGIGVSRGWVLCLDFEFDFFFKKKKKKKKKKESRNDRRGTCHITFVITVESRRL